MDIGIFSEWSYTPNCLEMRLPARFHLNAQKVPKQYYGNFSLALEKGERERGGEEKGEKRREKEKRKGKDYEVMGRAPAAF